MAIPSRGNWAFLWLIAGSDGGEAERHFEYAESEALVYDQLENSEIGFGDR